MSILDLQDNPFYDEETLRVMPPAEFLEELPIKEVTQDELNELMCEADYNPVHYYDQKIVAYDREVGHDLHYRYVIKRG